MEPRLYLQSGAYPRGYIKGFVPPNCPALYLKGIRQQMSAVKYIYIVKFMPQNEILGTPLFAADIASGLRARIQAYSEKYI